MDIQKIDPKIDESWKKLLIDEFSMPYFYTLKQFLVEEKKQYVIFPLALRSFRLSI